MSTFTKRLLSVMLAAVMVFGNAAPAAAADYGSIFDFDDGAVEEEFFAPEAQAEVNETPAAAAPEYELIDPATIKDSAVANSYQNGETHPEWHDGPASWAFDGNTQTAWHTKYDEGGVDDRPNQTGNYTIEWSVGGGTVFVGKLGYLRKDGADNSVNGRWKTFKVYGKAGSGGAWLEIPFQREADAPEGADIRDVPTGEEAVILFDEPMAVTHLKVEILSTNYGGQAGMENAVSAGEIRTYKVKDPDSEPPTEPVGPGDPHTDATHSHLSSAGFSNFQVSSQQDDPTTEGHAELAFDGDRDTAWHTVYNGNAGQDAPHHIEWDLGQEVCVNRMIYQHKNGQVNGKWKQIRIEATMRDGTVKTVYTGTLNDTAESVIDFTETAWATHLKVTVDSSYGDVPDKFASAGEIEVYHDPSVAKPPEPEPDPEPEVPGESWYPAEDATHKILPRDHLYEHEMFYQNAYDAVGTKVGETKGSMAFDGDLSTSWHVTGYSGSYRYLVWDLAPGMGVDIEAPNYMVNRIVYHAPTDNNEGIWKEIKITAYENCRTGALNNQSIHNDGERVVFEGNLEVTDGVAVIDIEPGVWANRIQVDFYEDAAGTMDVGAAEILVYHDPAVTEYTHNFTLGNFEDFTLKVGEKVHFDPVLLDNGMAVRPQSAPIYTVSNTEVADKVQDAVGNGWSLVGKAPGTTPVSVKVFTGYFSHTEVVKTINVTVEAAEPPVVKHDVTFKAEGQQDITVQVEDGQTIGEKMPANPAAPEGQEFRGWFDDQGNEVTKTTPVTGPMTVTARFAPIAPAVPLELALDQTHLYLELSSQNYPGTLTWKLTDPDGNSVTEGVTMSWRTEQLGYAAVENGVVTPVAAGTETVYAVAAYQGMEYEAQCTVTVYDRLQLPEPAQKPGTAEINLGTDKLVAANKQFYIRGEDRICFGDNTANTWRVLDPDHSNVFGNGVLVISDHVLGTTPFCQPAEKYQPESKLWERSMAKEWCGEYLDTHFSAAEQSAIQTVTCSDADTYAYESGYYGSSTLDNDKLFFLSTRELNDYMGAADKDGYITATDLSGKPTEWWLRSPSTSDRGGYYVGTGKGVVAFASTTHVPRGARPAFNLNPGSVLMMNLDGGVWNTAVLGRLAPIPAVPDPGKRAGNTWALTLLDSSRSFAVTEESVVGTSVTLHYTGARTGDNEYISALVLDAAGTPVYFGRLAKAAAEGQVTLTLPEGFTEGTLKLFNEQYNGEKRTAYASAFDTVTVTAAPEPVAEPVAKIGETNYATLHEAFAAAKDGETITMLKAVTLGTDKEPAGPLVLDGNRTVTLDACFNILAQGTGSTEAENTVVKVANGAALNLKLSAVIANTAADHPTCGIHNLGTVTLTATGTFDQPGIVAGAYSDGTLTMTAQAVGIRNEGTLNVRMPSNNYVSGVYADSVANAKAVALENSGTAIVSYGQIIGVASRIASGTAHMVGLQNTGTANIGSDQDNKSALIAGTRPIFYEANDFGTVGGDIVGIRNEGNLNLIGTSKIRSIERNGRPVAVTGDNLAMDAVIQVSGKLVTDRPVIYQNYTPDIHGKWSVDISGTYTPNALRILGGETELYAGAINLDGPDYAPILLEGGKLTIRNRNNDRDYVLRGVHPQNFNGPALKVAATATVAPVIEGGTFGYFGNAEPDAVDIVSENPQIQGFLTGGIFYHAFAQGHNDPALIASGYEAKRGSTSGNMWQESASGNAYRIAEKPVVQVPVTFQVEGRTYREIQVLQGQPIGDQMPANPTVEGKNFLGWVSGGEAVTRDTVVRMPMLVEAQLEVIPVADKMTAKVNGTAVGGDDLADLLAKSGVAAENVTELEFVSGNISKADLTTLGTLQNLVTFKCNLNENLTIVKYLNFEKEFPKDVFSKANPDNILVRVGHPKLEVVELNGFDRIMNDAFTNCTALRSVTANDLTFIGTYGFDGCTALETVTMPQLKSIQGYAFARTSALKTVDLSHVDTLRYYAFIDSGAFLNEEGVLELTIPAGVKQIDQQVFGRGYPLGENPDTTQTTVFHVTMESAVPPKMIASYGHYGFNNPAEGSYVLVPEGAEEAYRAHAAYKAEDGTWAGLHLGMPAVKEYVDVTFVNGDHTETVRVEKGQPLTALPDAPQAPQYKIFLGWFHGETQADTTTPINEAITYTAAFGLQEMKNRDVNFYVYIDKAPVLVENRTGLTVYKIDGRQSIPATLLEEIYGAYGFTAEQLTQGSKRFANTDRNGGTIYADVEAKVVDGMGYAPTLNRDQKTQIDVFYLPNHSVTNSTGKTNAEMMARETFYTVSNDQNADKVYVLNGTAIGETRMPADPTREGFTFAGWQDANGQEITAATPIQAPTQLKAQWTAQGVCKIQETDTVYETVAEAAKAAQAGQHIVMLQDAAEDMVALRKGVTLDLNGKTLTAEYVLTFKGNHIVDTTAHLGKLIVTSSIALDENNAQMAVFDVDGYRFGNMLMNQELETPAGNTMTVWMKPFFADKETSLPMFSNGARDNQIGMGAALTWTREDGSTAVQTFVFSDSMVAEAYIKGTLKVLITGVEGLKDVQVRTMVISDAGITAYGENLVK